MNLNVDVDRRFPRRVTWTSAVFGAVLYMCLLQYGLSDWALGTAFGGAVGVLSFDVFRLGVRTFLRPPETKERKPIATWKKITVGVLFAIKLPIWLVTIYTAVIDPAISIFAFVAGLALPQFVMVTKVLSKGMVETPSSPGETDASTELTLNKNTR